MRTHVKNVQWWNLKKNTKPAEIKAKVTGQEGNERKENCKTGTYKRQKEQEALEKLTVYSFDLQYVKYKF